MRTGKRFYPHLIRTIWATEFLEEKQDYAVAATMLGDTLAVVMKTITISSPRTSTPKPAPFWIRRCTRGSRARPKKAAPRGL